MAGNDSLTDYLQEQLAALGGVTMRRMFGGIGVFCDGLMFGIVADDAIFLKADAVNRAAFEAEGLEPLTYEARGRVVELPYRQVPERLLDDPDELVAWSRAALAAAQRAAAGRKARKRKAR
jgi:DNA transformation protein